VIYFLLQIHLVRYAERIEELRTGREIGGRLLIEDCVLLTLQPDYSVEQAVFRSLEFERVHTIQYYPFRLDPTVHREPIDVDVLTAIVD